MVNLRKLEAPGEVPISQSRPSQWPDRWGKARGRFMQAHRSATFPLESGEVSHSHRLCRARSLLISQLQRPSAALKMCLLVGHGITNKCRQSSRFETQIQDICIYTPQGKRPFILHIYNTQHISIQREEWPFIQPKKWIICMAYQGLICVRPP